MEKLRKIYAYVLIPVKIFISLPIIEVPYKGKILSFTRRDALIPSRLIHNIEDSGDMNIFTVGGIEHNRPLMRLINAHRQQYKSDRIFGFFDNIFDFIHRWKNNQKERFEHYFIMGVNQPVSAFNQVIIQRKDYNGNSISKAAKQIFFKVYDEFHGVTVNTLSVYGFSALSSAYATLYSIAFIKKGCKDQEALPIAAKALGPTATHAKQRGSTVFIKFEENIEENLYKITNGLEYFSFVRVDNGQLLRYITSGAENGGAVSEFIFGRRKTKA